MRVVKAQDGYVDYRLHILGIRVWRGCAQLIAKDGESWDPFGFRHPLPIKVPASTEELPVAAGDTLRLTGWLYDQENPGSDIRDMLLQQKNLLDYWAD
jgi:hypothetical protein